MEEAETQPPTQSSHRHNSAPLPIPARLTLPSHSGLPNSTASFDLPSLKSSSQSYTSLKDLLPSSPAATVNSPTANCAYEISIRNRLVKQAAWAYLQPMSEFPGSSGPHLFRRIWIKLSSARTSLSSCLRFVNLRIISGLSRALDRFLGAMWVLVHR